MDYVRECESLIEAECGGKAFLVTSCTSALEIACALTLKPGDEVILPSWAHPANVCAIVRAGAVPVFIDVDENLNLDVSQITVTPKTKAIMPLHYAGVVADSVKGIAEQYGLYVIEDAAQAIGNWKVRGDFGCLSFHKTKNIQCGEGGALIVNNPAFVEKAERYISWGTDKARFNRGEIKGWKWYGLGSSYSLSSYAAEHLYQELMDLETITTNRILKWHEYARLYPSPKHCGNGHLFWMFVDDRDAFLKINKATTHFEALHMTETGRKYGRVGGKIVRATEAMRKLVKFSTC